MNLDVARYTAFWGHTLCPETSGENPEFFFLTLNH